MKYKHGQQVYVSGQLPWGDWKGERAATRGHIVKVQRVGLLVNLEYIGGDFGVTTLVPKKLCRPVN